MVKEYSLVKCLRKLNIKLHFFWDFPAILISMIIDKFDGSDHRVVTSHQKTTRWYKWVSAILAALAWTYIWNLPLKTENCIPDYFIKAINNASDPKIQYCPSYHLCASPVFWLRDCKQESAANRFSLTKLWIDVNAKYLLQMIICEYVTFVSYQ